MNRTIGIFFMGGDDWSFVIALWFRTLVVRPDKGNDELFSFRTGIIPSFPMFGIRFIWRP